MALIVNPQQDQDEPGEETAATAPDVAVVLRRPAPEPDPAGDPQWGTPPEAADPPAADEPAEMVLFELDGVKYLVPRKPGPNVALGYLRDVRNHGQEYARAGLLERFIGAEGMDALADYEDLTDEDLEKIWALVEKHVLGGVNRGKAPARPTDRTPRRSPAGKR
jgi:hypothetical protein